MTSESYIDKKDLTSLFGNKKFVTTTEMEAVGIAPQSTLGKWRKYGEGPPYLKVSKGRVLYEVEELADWLKACHVDPKTSPCKKRRPNRPLKDSNLRHVG